jgi:hypothetical protein
MAQDLWINPKPYAFDLAGRGAKLRMKSVVLLPWNGQNQSFSEMTQTTRNDMSHGVIVSACKRSYNTIVATYHTMVL